MHISFSCYLSLEKSKNYSPVGWPSLARVAVIGGRGGRYQPVWPSLGARVAVISLCGRHQPVWPSSAARKATIGLSGCHQRPGWPPSA